MKPSKRLLAALFVFAAATASAAPPELKYVVILSRHGVRSPTWDAARLNQYSAEPWPDWGVPPGILTAHGRELMKLMGSFYHDWAAGQKLLPASGCAGASHVFIWADTAQRTMESARALSEGMLPGCTAEVHAAGEGNRDPLFDPIEAGLVKSDAALSLASVAGRIGPKLDAVVDAHRPAFDLLTRLLNGGGKAAKSIFDDPVTLASTEASVNMGGPLNLASTLSEDFLLEYTDGMSGAKLGWGRLDAAKLQEIMALHTAYADLMRRTPYLARARGSNLLSHIVHSMEQAVSGKAQAGALGSAATSLLLIAGHDTNISNLSGTLGLTWLLPSYQQDDAPPGGALIFSLWKSPDTGSYSVRLQFAAQTMDQMHDATPLTLANPPAISDVFIPGCSSAAAGYPCDWAAFLKAAQ